MPLESFIVLNVFIINMTTPGIAAKILVHGSGGSHFVAGLKVPNALAAIAVQNNEWAVYDLSAAAIRCFRHRQYVDEAKTIPWYYLGPETAARRLSRSLIPIGTYPHPLPKIDDANKSLRFTSDDPEFEKYLMNIVGTGILASKDFIVTCLHVVQSMRDEKSTGYALLRFRQQNGREFIFPSSYPGYLRYLDPRTKKVNHQVNLALIPFRVRGMPQLPPVQWGDSEKLGVGDKIMVGGYPYGTDLFRITESNRGFIRPTFYEGIVSAIIPTMREHETRLLQLSVMVAGGMSGGAVLNPKNGRVVGMVTSGLESSHGSLHPVTYALPSEIILPLVKHTRPEWA